MPVPSLQTKEQFERMFDPDRLSTLGDRWDHAWRGSQRYRMQLYADILAEVCKNDIPESILDIGCGQSMVLGEMERLFPSARLFGNDISENVIQWNRQAYPANTYASTALPEVGHGTDLFDLVCAFEVVYYLQPEEQMQSLGNILASLKPGGRLILSGGLDGGKRYFETSALTAMLEEAGYEMERCFFQYAKLYTRLEAAPLRRFRAFEERLREHPDCDLARLGSRVLKTILGWRVLPEVCAGLTRRVYGEEGRTHVIAVARKPHGGVA